MTTAAHIYLDIEKLDVCVCFAPLKGNKAISASDGIICVDCTQMESHAEECTVAIHECGHFISGAFYTPYSPWQVKEQAEWKANKAAIAKYIPNQEIKHCVENGITELWELAEYFNVTEQFMLMAILYYKEQLLAG